MLWACQLLWVFRVLMSGHLQIHHTAWKGKGDVYHLVFDVTQFIYGGHCIYSAVIKECLLRSSCTTSAHKLSAEWRPPSVVGNVSASATPGRVWPEEDKGEVELLLMLISHICGRLLMRAPAWAAHSR